MFLSDVVDVKGEEIRVTIERLQKRASLLVTYGKEPKPAVSVGINRSWPIHAMLAVHEMHDDGAVAFAVIRATNISHVRLLNKTQLCCGCVRAEVRDQCGFFGALELFGALFWQPRTNAIPMIVWNVTECYCLAHFWWSIFAFNV